MRMRMISLTKKSDIIFLRKIVFVESICSVTINIYFKVNPILYMVAELPPTKTSKRPGSDPKVMFFL